MVIFNIHCSILVFAIFLQTIFECKGCSDRSIRYRLRNKPLIKISFDHDIQDGSYPIGTIATFYCEDGYILSGERGYSFCSEIRFVTLNRGWVGPPEDLSCIPQTEPCQSLSSVQGLQYNASSATDPEVIDVATFPVRNIATISVNDVATFSCSLAYTLLRGSSTATCNSEGQWKYNTEHPAVCVGWCPPVLTLPQNGNLRYRGTFVDGKHLHGSTASFYCNPGYSLNGYTEFYCGVYGWQPFSIYTPQCLEATCPPISLSNGLVSYSNDPIRGGYIPETTATVTCDNGYDRYGWERRNCKESCRVQQFIVFGADQRECETPRWEGPDSSCARPCTPLSQEDHVQVSYNGNIGNNGGYYLGTQATISCASGYYRSAGDEVRTCHQPPNLEWSGSPATCTQNPPPPPPSDSGSCFPSMSKVQVMNGNSVRMWELQYGDKVQTGTEYNEVKTFMKRQHNVRIMYRLITTSTNSTIALSGKHLIFSRTKSTIYADDVSIGDEVLVQDQFGFAPAKVTNVSSWIMQGAFTPVTRDGTIVVDGVLASCYAFSDHDVAHFSTIPIRWFPSLSEIIFGKDSESPAYISVAAQLARIMMPSEMNYF